MASNETCTSKERSTANDLLSGLRSNFRASEVGAKSHFVWCKADRRLTTPFTTG